MKKHSDTPRRSIFKKGKFRAFIRFLIGEMILFIICAALYFFLIKPYPLTTQAQSPAAPTPDATQEATIAPTFASSAPAPTPEPKPSVMPTPAPTDAPVEFSPTVAPISELPAPAEAIKYGMISFKPVNSDTQHMLSLSAYAYIEGEDAALSQTYLVVLNETGIIQNTYATTKIGNTAGLEINGVNPDEICFTACVDVSGYADGWYGLGLVIINSGRTEYTEVDVDTYSFFASNGTIEQYAE